MLVSKLVCKTILFDEKIQQRLLKKKKSTQILKTELSIYSPVGRHPFFG